MIMINILRFRFSECGNIATVARPDQGDCQWFDMRHHRQVLKWVLAMWLMMVPILCKGSQRVPNHIYEMAHVIHAVGSN
jgi:hypothetical protein